MTKLLLITSMYPPHHYGGYELSCRDVVERLRDRGHDVTVLTTDLRIEGVDSTDGGDRDRDNAVQRELEPYWRDHRFVRPNLWSRAGIERRNQARLRDALTRIRPDAVSLWHMGGVSLGLLSTLAASGLPLVYVVCDDWLIYGPTVDPWAGLFHGHPWLASTATWLTGVPARLPDVGSTGVFCFVSESVRRHAEASSWWSYPDSTVVYSGVDRAEFPARPGGSDRPWRWRLLYVGRIDPRKGIDTAVRALADLPEATLTIVGRGDDTYLARLRRLAADLGVGTRVAFEDAVDRGNLRARYWDADALVFPTVWDEPFGLVPIEAMSCGLPVVATCTGGSSEFLRDDSNCLRFAPGDAAGLAAAVRRLAADPSLRAQLLRSGLQTAAQLDVDHLADALEAWHVAAAGGFRTGRPADRRPLDVGVKHG